MPYTALPDRRMAYDNDGTVVGYTLGTNAGASFAAGFGGTYHSQADLQELQDEDFVLLTGAWSSDSALGIRWWFFFPERREVTAYALLCGRGGSGAISTNVIEGSTDTTNGNDGTWETASLPNGASLAYQDTGYDSWRSTIKAISFTGGKNTIRLRFNGNGAALASVAYYGLHLYGEKVAGQTPHDLVFINHDDTPGVEYTTPEDFGDRPLGTSVVRQFRLKNTSASRTAANINIQCNDADFAISTDNVNWVVTINIASLAPGAESATMYIRNTTPAPGNALGPRFARIVVIAEQNGSPGSNFFA